MRYFIELAYNGKEYHGWQSQPNQTTVQSTLEGALSKLLRAETSLVGAGRTDTGVHARQMFAHFDSDFEIVDKKRFLLSFNSMVGKDIFIRDIFPVDKESHARFDAIERTYKYFVNYSKNPFLKDLCWHTPSGLDISAMNSAAQILLNTTDFTSFAKLHSDVKTNNCKVTQAFWQPVAKDKEASEFLGTLDNGIVFTISADRFLRNMVRAIVGTLVDVGRHKIGIDEFIDIINDKNRCSAGTSMPAGGLFLWKIRYPFV